MGLKLIVASIWNNDEKYFQSDILSTTGSQNTESLDVQELVLLISVC